MEAQKPKTSQGKKKVKKSKFKSNDGTLKECSYETLPQEVESLHVSDIEEGSCSRTECVTDIEVALSEAFQEECEEESVRLLDALSRENLATPELVNVPAPVEDESKELEVKQTEIENYIQNYEFTQCIYPTVDTELKELESSTTLPNVTSLADTNFESPIHLPKSPSVEPAEDPLELWIEQVEETEIANEATPSAPSLQPGCNSAIESDVCEAEPDQVLVNKPFFPLMEKEEEVSNELKPYTLPQLANLYRNPELDAGEDFVAQFVETELHGGDVQRHPLYELLVNYQRAKAKISVNTVELNGLKVQSKELKSQLWSMEKCSITERGECQDGNPVEATHEFQTAHYNKASASNLSRCLCSIRDLISEAFALNAYTCQIFKLQVDNFIQQLEAEMSFLPHNSLVNLVPETLPSSSSQTGKDLYSVIKELRQAISVLFYFQGRPVRDEEFLADTRAWLTRLVAVLLRVATWREHLFLLNHVLRCPAGVSKWATSFIQPPIAPQNNPFSSQHLDHLVTCLASILLPVKQRDLFLSQVCHHA